MNTVVSDPRTSQFRDPLIKHVIMEKEIYDCVDPEGGMFVRDVETFIEIIQRVQGGRTTTVEKRVEELICDKGNVGGGYRVRCSARDVPLLQGTDGVNCNPTPPQDRAQPKDPVEMNTVITSRQDTVKTFKVDKELLDCGSFDPRITGHLYLFSEIVEQRVAAGGADNIRPTEKKFQAILCLAHGPLEPDGRVIECRHVPEF
jgi:hypothetical protein